MNEDTIRTIHYLISKSLPGKYAPGRYRAEQNYVVNRITQRRIFLPPSAEDVPVLMQEFVTWLNSEQNLPGAIKAALAHLNLVAIHPFADGNGRTARVVDSLVMYGSGFKSQDLVSLEAYFGRDNRGYYEAFASVLGPRYAPPHDVTEWIEYYLHAHVEQAGITIQEIRNMVAEMDRLQEVFGSEGLSISQTIVLWLASRRSRISNRAYRTITGRSAQSAVVDFRKLMDKDLLVRTGKGRSTAYVPSQRVRNAFNEIRQKISEEPEPL